MGALLALQAPTFTGLRNDLKLDDLYAEKALTGKTAAGSSFSHDDRYIAYLWNPYDDRGNDIWVYDTLKKQSFRLTSVDMMAKFDRETKAIADRYKKEREEDEKKAKEEAEKAKSKTDTKVEDKSGDKSPVELLFNEEGNPGYQPEDKEPQQRGGGRRPDGPHYGGISEFEWANTSSTILFTYKGDVYRIRIGEDVPTRFTKTQEVESNLLFTKADDGYFFRRGQNVFRMKFNDSFVEQLNPTLPQGMTMAWYSISPDETKMAMSSSRSTGAADRQVSYIVYRGRFAEARTVSRGVADDNFNGESYLYLYDLNDDVIKNPENDGKPWEIYKWAAGKEYGQTSLASKPWSKDSSKFVFSTWKRDRKEIDVMVADVKSKKTESVYNDKLNGGHTTPGRAQPMFMPDDNRILITTDKSGFMQFWTIDPAKKEATQLTKGDFEVEPVSFTKDGLGLIATADKENPARAGLYRVSLSDGSFTPIANKEGNYGSPVVSHSTDLIAATFRSWTSLVELNLIDSQGQTPLTSSHKSEDFFKLQKLQPQLFSYKNRHGHTVRGYMYLPPDYKKGDKRPLWMYTYGGPLGSRGKDVVDGSFNSFNMYMAYKYGYITCSIDPRGMSGYGGMWESANWESPGKAQTEDLTDAVTFFDKEYGIDKERVGINGWSFGGFQTQMCLFTAPDVFKLGIAGAGPTEWQNYNTWYTGGVIGFSRPGNANDLDKYSLTKLAKNLKGKLMLLHGMEDTNVLYQDTVKVYQALLQAGKGSLVELVVDPTGGHGLGGDIKTKDRYLIYEGYLARNWGTYSKKK